MSEDSSDEFRDIPPERAEWVSGAAMERVVRDAPADHALLDDLADTRQQVIEPR